MAALNADLSALMRGPSTARGLPGELVAMLGPAAEDLTDPVAPVISIITPAGAILANDAVVFRVTDDKEVLALIEASVVFTPSGYAEVVYSGGAFAGQFSTSTNTAIAGGVELAARQSGGWWENFTLRVTASDPSGNLVTASRAYTVTNAPGVPGSGAGPSPNPPIVSAVTPDLAARILPDTELGFTVTDADGDLHSVMVFALFDDGSYEVIHDGTSFAPRYLQNSVRVAVVNGFRYRLRRVGGWPTAPRLRVAAFDTSLNEL